MSPGELSDVVASLADKRLLPSVGAFELSSGLIPFSRRNRTLWKRQVQVLEAVQSLSPPAQLVTPDDPIDEGVSGSWVGAGPGVWKLPDDVSADSLMREFLHLGNWHLLAGAPAVSIARLPDTYRRPTSAVRAFMAQHKLWLLLDAFHDCTYWRVFLEPNLMPTVPAA